MNAILQRDKRIADDVVRTLMTIQMHFFDILTWGLFVLHPLVIRCLCSARLQKCWCQRYDRAVKMKFVNSSLRRRRSLVHSTPSRRSYDGRCAAAVRVRDD